MKRGFTLVELAFVLAVIALLAAITVPGYHVVVLRARAGEARAMLSAIAHAELMYRRDHGRYLECAPGEEPVPKKAERVAERPCWRDLGFRPDGLLRYRYRVKLNDTGFDAIAEGDLDADGTTSVFTLRSGDQRLTVENELE